MLEVRKKGRDDGADWYFSPDVESRCALSCQVVVIRIPIPRVSENQ